MSQTATQTEAPAVQAIFRYGEPDRSVSAAQRSLFAFPKIVNVAEEKMTLNDYRTDTKLARGVEGLHRHGFTLVENHSDPSNWATEGDVREKYIPTVEQLVKNITGCKTVITNSVVFRRKYPAQYDADSGFYHPKGGDLDKMLKALPCEQAMVSPYSSERSLEPARGMHVDYTMQGLINTVRHCRADMADAGAEALKALDAGERPPRFAAYSIWRPLKPVTRDPIAVLNWNSPGDITKDLHAFNYRAKGFEGDYLLEGSTLTKPERPEDHEWFHVSEQKPHEVLMIKFADSESDFDKDVAAGCGHGSPFIVGSEDEEPRESIEARVLAFW